MVACVVRICYEELQVVAAQLPENLSCVALLGLCRPTHYTGLSSQGAGVEHSNRSHLEINKKESPSPLAQASCLEEPRRGAGLWPSRSEYGQSRYPGASPRYWGVCRLRSNGNQC